MMHEPHQWLHSHAIDREYQIDFEMQCARTYAHYLTCAELQVRLKRNLALRLALIFPYLYVKISRIAGRSKTES